MSKQYKIQNTVTIGYDDITILLPWLLKRFVDKSRTYRPTKNEKEIE